MNVELLLQLVILYVKTVRLFSSKLLKHLKIQNLTEWRSLSIPIRGDFGDGWSYAFHGSGCCITSPEIEVDFEFDANLKVGGFDLWRLWSFICDNKKTCAKFIEFQDKEKLKQVFDMAVEEKLIVSKKDDLYYLAN